MKFKVMIMTLTLNLLIVSYIRCQLVPEAESGHAESNKGREEFLGSKFGPSEPIPWNQNSRYVEPKPEEKAQFQESSVTERPVEFAQKIDENELLKYPEMLASITEGVAAVAQQNRPDEATHGISLLLDKTLKAFKLLIIGVPFITGAAVYTTLQGLVGFAIGLVKGASFALLGIGIPLVNLPRHALMKGDVRAVREDAKSLVLTIVERKKLRLINSKQQYKI